MIFNKSIKNTTEVESKQNTSQTSESLEKIKSELIQINKMKIDITEINAKLSKFNDFFSYMFNIKDMQEATGTLKLFQVSCLKLAYNFTDFLKEHKITDYWLDFHSLLGAYRNETFAPWDDSVAFAFSKSSFLQLLEILEKSQYAIEFNLYQADFTIITSTNRANVVYNLAVRDNKKITAIINLFIYEEKKFLSEEELQEYKNSFRHSLSAYRSTDKMMVGSKDMQFSSIMRRIKDTRHYSSLSKSRVKATVENEALATRHYSSLSKNKVQVPIKNEVLASKSSVDKLVNLNLTNPLMEEGGEVYYVLSSEHSYKQPLLIKKSVIFPLKKTKFASYNFNAPCDIANYLSSIYKSLALNPYNLQEGKLFSADNITSIVSSEETLLQFITKK